MVRGVLMLLAAGALLLDHSRAGEPAPIELSSDAEAKRGEFWLEQHLTLVPPFPEGPLADLYAGLHPKTLAGLRLRLTASEARLEIVSAPGVAPQVLARGAPAFGETKPGEPLRGVLGFLWRGGEASAWWNEQLLFAWRGGEKESPSDLLRQPSAGAARAPAARLGPRRALAPESCSFHDSFMRGEGEDPWRPVAGRWERTGMSFPERSANPFALRASFQEQPPWEEALFRGRAADRNHFGLGIALGGRHDGIPLRVERITGGSPAARAGLREQDLILEINGRPVEHLDPGLVFLLLSDRPAGDNKVRLKVLRQGERQPREFNIVKDYFRWGTPLDSLVLQPVTEAAESAWITAGEAGWSDYRAEVSMKPLGSGGGGLAVAVTAPGEGLLLRWIGPPPRLAPAGKTAAPAPARAEGLQLVRLAKGAETVLAEKPARYRPYEFYRLALDWRGEEVRALVDGVEVFSTKVAGLRRGGVALCALRGEPVYFDDVAVAADRAALTGRRGSEEHPNAAFAFEADMERWANPALAWERDGRSPWAVYTRGVPHDQELTLREPRFKELEVRLLVAGAPRENAPALGPALVVKDGLAVLTTVAEGRAEARVGAGPFPKLTVRSNARGECSAEIGGVRLALPGFSAGSHPAWCGGDRICARGLLTLGAPAVARVRGARVLEYDFDRAPADWKVLCGRWGLMNKWICDPRWSWFGGRSETLAALWHKRVFKGDQALEADVALMMQHDDPPYNRAGYERGGDFNLVLCGDGVHPDSGYSLICGGGGNYWTRLYRRGRMVAASTAEAHRLPGDRIRQPDKPELHQRWFRLRLEKRGDTVSFHRDGQLAFEYRDPEPLSEGRAGVWTLDNGLLLARARITFDASAPGPLESRETALYEDEEIINQYGGETHTRVERVGLPREAAAALEAPATAFRPLTAPEDARPEGEPKAWRVINGMGGGPCALHWKNLFCDPIRNGVVRFAVRIEPGTAVDFCLRDVAGGRVYRWRLTGPPGATPATEYAGQSAPPGTPPGPPIFTEQPAYAGEIPGAAADGRWRVLQFDLGPSWEELWRRRGSALPPAVKLRPVFGCLEGRDYAPAGFGVNRAGASYAVSGLRCFAAGEVDAAPPRLAEAVWPFHPNGDGASLLLLFSDGAVGAGAGAARADGPFGVGVDFEALQVSLNGRQVPRSCQRSDYATQSLRVDLRAFCGSAALKDGARFELALAGLRDRAGNAAAPAKADWTFRLAEAQEARKATPVPEVQALLGPERRRAGPASILLHGVPEAADVAGPPRPNEAVARVEPVAPPDAAERRSARVTALRDGARFGCELRGPMLDLARWPYLALTCSIPPETPVNLFFADANGTACGVILTDTGDPEDVRANFGDGVVYLGRPEGFLSDGAWRRVEIPLLRMLNRALPGQEVWRASAFQFQDRGWRGSRAGMTYYLHALQALPAGRSEDLAFDWCARSLAEGRGFAAVVDEEAGTIPVGQGLRPLESVEAAARRALKEKGLPDPGPAPCVRDGWKNLHVRTLDAAGVWSPPAHYRFFVDNSPPSVLRTEPEDGGKTAAHRFRIRFSERHAILASSLRLRVNGVEFRGTADALRFDPAAQALTFDNLRNGPDAAWKEGGVVQVELLEVQDCLGNALREPHRFSFRSERGPARAGPEIAKVRFCPPGGTLEERLPRPLLREISFALDFEETLGQVRALRDCILEWSEDPRSAAFGRRAVKFTALEDDADLRILLHDEAWRLDQLPVLHFDYRTDGRFKADLQFQVLGEWRTVRFLGAGEAGKEAGAVEDATGDGRWHHAVVNLAEPAAGEPRELPSRIAGRLMLSSRGRPGTGRGATLWLDNLQLCPAGGRGRLEWEAAPNSEPVGYALLCDQRPDSEPPPIVTHREPRADCEPPAGTWRYHLRAVDREGNWGPTRHFRVDRR